MLTQPREASETWVTTHGLRKLEEDLAELRSRRAEVAERLRQAKELGNLEENTDFQEAKNEQALLESRIAELRETIAGASVLDPEDIPVDRVGLGSLVVVRDLVDEEEWELTLVAPAEADPDRDAISHECPLGQALLGRVPGDVVEVEAPLGRLQYEVLSIRRPA
ncbi:MAG: transcription elongation factor GreA [Armatimonadota bacterium]